jgi:chemotaxis family two-component system response regulator Rcp1
LLRPSGINGLVDSQTNRHFETYVMDERSIGAKPNHIFRILVVDDDPAGARVLQEVMKNLQRRHELHFVWNGAEALDFLHRRGAHPDAPRPDLVLLDINMPRVGGLETLSAMKSDPDLRVIPVIMLSTSDSPEDVRRSYEAHANCYVQKPTNLEHAIKLVRAVESFWMECVLLPACDERKPADRHVSDSKREESQRHAPVPAETHTGTPIAPTSAEARSRAMLVKDSPAKTETPSRKSGCEEHNRLLDEFGMAVRELIEFHEQQFLAIVEDDSECHRFDLLIHMTNEKKQRAKYDYLRHVEEHGCSNFNAINDPRT